MSGYTPKVSKAAASAIDYAHLEHSCQQLYHDEKMFSLGVVFVQPTSQPSQPQHGRKKSVSYSFKGQHHHIFLHTVLCMHTIPVHLCGSTQVVYFSFSYCAPDLLTHQCILSLSVFHTVYSACHQCILSLSVFHTVYSAWKRLCT